jgi:hypothetical protein
VRRNSSAAGWALDCERDPERALGNLPGCSSRCSPVREGLILVVQAALVGSIIANSVLVLGIAFVAGGLRNGTQRFDLAARPDDATLTRDGGCNPGAAHARTPFTPPRPRERLSPDLRWRLPRAVSF